MVESRVTILREDLLSFFLLHFSLRSSLFGFIFSSVFFIYVFVFMIMYVSCCTISLTVIVNVKEVHRRPW